MSSSSNAISVNNYTRSDSGARSRTVLDRLQESISVLEFGTDSTALSNAATAASSAGKKLLIPGGTYTLTSSWTPPLGLTIESHGATFECTVANAPAVILQNDVKIEGKLIIDCNETTGSIGLQFGASGLGCQHAVVENVEVLRAAAYGIRFFSDTTNACFLNQAHRLKARLCTGVACAFHTTVVGVNWANANFIGYLSLQNNTGSAALLVNGGDGNTIGYLEAESNDGDSTWAIDLQDAIVFSVLGCWLEGNTKNIRIADDPAVEGVWIAGSIGWNVGITSSDDFSHTYSANRYVTILANNDKFEYGRFRVAGDLVVGLNGTPANDQGVLAKASVSGGIDCYRYRSDNQYFLFRGQHASMGFHFSADGAQIIDANTTRMDLPGDLQLSVAGKGLKVKEGSNAKQGTATLSGGTIAVSNTSVTANSRILLTGQDNNVTGSLRVSARSAGVSFTITSSEAGDSGVVAYEIFEPA